MKQIKYTSSLAALAFLLCFHFTSFAQTSRQYSVLTWATTTDNPASITIHFEDDVLANSYLIFRKDLGATGWGSAITSINSGGSGDLSYKDNSVTAGKSYEYFIQKTGSGSFRGYGYINIGVGLPAMHNRGTVLFIVDKETSDSLGSDLDILRSDLSGDGYRVIDYVVDRDVNHETIKDHIAETKKLYTDLNTLYIFGHVAVPYSGKYCNHPQWSVPPDGHRAGVGDHCGAWAADVFYAVPEGTWTDMDTVDFGARRAWNKNAVGDLKYDQITLPGTVEYQLGRVDLSNLPTMEKSEMTLLRQYINKNHNYRYGLTKPYQRALIDENFNPSTEAFAGNGYRNFAAMVGRDNIIESDYMTTLADSNFMWAYATGPGSFISAGGIGNTGNFNTNQGAATFNFTFGSFFGDWDNANAFLRAPLAVENGGLINAWAGRPWWHTHPMALNQTIGYCTKLVQNNKQEYVTGFFQNNIHIALMGDPTLRMHMFDPPTALNASVSSDNMKVTLNWTASAASGLDGYNVYFSTSKYGTYYIANANPISGTTFVHNSVGIGTYYYMVRAQRMETTLSGTFVNLSQGVTTKVDNLIQSSVTKPEFVQELIAFPNPTTGLIDLRYTTLNGNPINIQVSDLHGRVLLTTTQLGIGTQIVPLDLRPFQSGIYVVQVGGNALKVVVE